MMMMIKQYFISLNPSVSPLMKEIFFVGYKTELQGDRRSRGNGKDGWLWCVRNRAFSLPYKHIISWLDSRSYYFHHKSLYNMPMFHQSLSALLKMHRITCSFSQTLPVLRTDHEYHEIQFPSAWQALVSLLLAYLRFIHVLWLCFCYLHEFIS